MTIIRKAAAIRAAQKTFMRLEVESSAVEDLHTQDPRIDLRTKK